MIEYYKTINGRITKVDSYEKQCWINCVCPVKEEVNFLISECGVEADFLRSALDEEEPSHVDVEGDTSFIVVDSPVVHKSGKSFTYYTVPLSVIITPDNVITIALKENSIVEEFSEGLIKSAAPEYKTCFALQIMLRIVNKYVQYLNQIDKITSRAEVELKKSMKNDGLIQLFEMRKSLVYFSSSLKSISLVTEKISRGRYLKLDETDKIILEDLDIEIRQAAEMSEIYREILTNTMESFSSIMYNNLNEVMKRLESITLIVSIPTLIAGIYGMNNPGLFEIFDFTGFAGSWWFPLVMSLIIMTGVAFILKRKDMI